MYVMYSSQSSLLHIPQTPEAEWLTLIGVLLGLAGGNWRGGHVLFCDGSLQVRADRLLEQGLLTFKPSVSLSCWYTVLTVF